MCTCLGKFYKVFLIEMLKYIVKTIPDTGDTDSLGVYG